MNHRHYYILGFTVMAVILVSAVLLNPNSDFSGTDDSGGDIISDTDPDYQPWFNSLWEPSGELATLLFTLQAAIGALVIGYFLGSNKARKGIGRSQEK
ncbi:MAG TPA: energy-coupling factor ABC transporter substrate-binding protein [Methanomassiliicoccales archaeon]|nr:energy-coupling factor ABC transporter substrate-binding protein [Methanomassiliicoccales archaeon]